MRDSANRLHGLCVVPFERVNRPIGVLIGQVVTEQADVVSARMQLRVSLLRQWLVAKVAPEESFTARWPPIESASLHGALASIDTISAVYILYCAFIYIQTRYT